MSLPALRPPDYLLIGHVTRDLLSAGERLGGTVTYAGLTAAAWGLTVGAVTSCAAGQDLGDLSGMRLFRLPAAHTTTFENLYHGTTREQILHHVAERLTPAAVPLEWRTARIVHLAPVADEVDFGLIHLFPHSFVGVTPQGWMRAWDKAGHVRRREPGPQLLAALGAASACVFSVDDVQGDERIIALLVERCPITAVTENAHGAHVYWNGHVRNFPAPRVEVRDPTGAGDVFAASFFARLAETHDPWEAARAATLLASASVALEGLAGIPSREDVARSRPVVERP